MSFELSIVRIGLETTEVRVRNETRIAAPYVGRRRPLEAAEALAALGMTHTLKGRVS